MMLSALSAPDIKLPEAFRAFLILFVLILLSEVPLVESKELFNIYWNTSNPMFRKGLHQNIIQVNVGNLPWEYDQANIICPRYEEDIREADIETFIIYIVSKEEYDSCRIHNPNPRIIALCNTPHEARYYTITFRSFTPTPGGLEFTPGNSYYFVSTSSRQDLHRRIGGRCSSHNMRLVVELPTSKEEIPSLNEPRSTVSPPSPSKVDYNFYYEYPLNDFKNEEQPDIFLQDNKLKSSAKQEASVMNHTSGIPSLHPWAMTLVVSSLGIWLGG